MNYANLIDDAKLKKTFIVATLVSTVIGTFQAASTLHDKLEEKRERRQTQQALDSKQNKALKELQEKLKELEDGDKKDGDGEKGGKNDGRGRDGDEGKDNKKKEVDHSSPRSRSRSRSRSRRRRRSRDEWEDNTYFAESARRSQAMIERTYNDHLQRLGPTYAQGDMITENALQAQTIRLQQTVIGILQGAINTGRGLTREDLDRLIAAQSSARDGSLRALNSQYDRIAYPERKSAVLGERPVEVATYQHEPVQFAIEPANPSTKTTRDTAVLTQSPVEELSHRSVIVPPPPPRTVQREFDRLALESPAVNGSNRSSRRCSPHRATTTAATVDAKVAPSSVDRVLKHQQRRVRGESPPHRRKSTSLVTQTPKTSVPERKVSSLVNGAPSLMDKGTASSTIAKTDAAQMDGRTVTSQTRSPPKSRRDSMVPFPVLGDVPAKKSTSMIVQEPKTPTPNIPSTTKQDTAKSTFKALPTAPYELFCKYSLDLQNSRSKSLSNTFRPSGDHRCPTCQIKIPVDTRDVWILSTHFPGKENRHKIREYRMDSRFVVKCHRPEGGFACVLCDRFRDMDCLCTSVEALVKHLGTAHTPDEFERDSDLVRMKDGAGLEVKSREVVFV